MEQTKLIFPSFDATMTKLKVKPKYLKTSISYVLKLWDDEREKEIKYHIRFSHAAAFEFRMNLFDTPVAEVMGLYEIFDREEKLALLEHNFAGRKEAFLTHGDYDYDAEDEGDLLNYRHEFERIVEDIDRYRLFEQQTTGGYYLILAKTWEMWE